MKTVGVGVMRGYLEYVRDEVALRLNRGARLADVQREVIDVAPGVSEDERAALWLYAWSYSRDGAMSARRVVESIGG